MSIEISDLTTLVGDTAVAELAAREEAVRAAVRQVEHEHPGYSYSYSTEIRCNAWGCGRYMDIKVGKGHQNAAPEAFAAHRAERVDALLAEWFPAPENEDLGN
ncbi:hypothetical protein [Paenarthrobacter sp. YJN-5]|uniref:hypothetical protein n=1 Tax=Paenarthrobacter sp. YJN-5 TaxID=2735316 RepID=UPI0018788C13|nr:hypothetical protein [Paenarthrobacter sp. YJN-5]QOT19590.1 hypothetical protein HMI59_23495 [Paenarthrobacter sp. YJN-5]